ncbi:ubl carboxyl-terminal hydrolase 18 isoform X1 [Podarcis raffonei]|uniref:ubl carboxyl-terminal hydrolase 18 isoform X1 n=2 Tax=Podarcis raffonei TaxID=65483 RepID=UPI0023297505|nr:ubl carboxyl-terminal hydrolase 18 isoform X1 [Podarcis raffonei]
MGQRAGRPKPKRTFKLEEYQTMTAEADEESSTEEALETCSQKLQEICGMADSRNGAVGLYNIGLNCCLNSLLQVLFMNRQFTMILRRIKVPFEAAEQKASVPYQMLLLLEQMQRSKRRSVHPLDLVRCLSMHNVKLLVLYDASQLFLILWNLIKDQITNVNLVESLALLHTIQLQQNLVCQKCSAEMKKESNLLMFPLPMFDSDSHPVRTLGDSLRRFFAPEQLVGENACHCEQCGLETPHLRGLRVTRLPQTLMLHLKRFCCTEGSQTWKISHSLAFPQSLNFSEILMPEQYNQDAQEDDGLYDLFAVVAHSGSANFGHYSAYIWSLTESRWYCFNDSSVCQVSWDDVKCTYGKAYLRWGETAYLLVYLKRNCWML